MRSKRERLVASWGGWLKASPLRCVGVALDPASVKRGPFRWRLIGMESRIVVRVGTKRTLFDDRGEALSAAAGINARAGRVCIACRRVRFQRLDGTGLVACTSPIVGGCLDGITLGNLSRLQACLVPGAWEPRIGVTP